MKKLILIRHAKSSWEHNVIDHERPLNKRGHADADLVSKYLARINPQIDYILCSDSKRTKQTAGYFIDNMALASVKFEQNHDLYDFSGENLIITIKQANSSINTLMVFGHNHAVTYFVNNYGGMLTDNVPTCGVNIMEFDIEDWTDLQQAVSIKTIVPKTLKNHKM